MTRTIPLTPEMVDLLKKQKERFIKKFGREPGPNDPVFFDEEESTPTPPNPKSVPLDKLNFADGTTAFIGANVGFKGKPGSLVDDVATAMSQGLSVTVRPAMKFSDRATFVVGEEANAKVDQIVAVLKSVRSTSRVTYAEIYVRHGYLHYTFACDVPDEVVVSCM